jgi:hypothetical protein
MPAHIIYLGLTSLIIVFDKHTILSYSLCTLLQLPDTSATLYRNFPLSTLLSNAFNLRSSLNVKTKFHTHKKTGKIMVLRILILKFLERRWEEKEL